MKKHIIITGSTDGIGKLAAIKLAKEGHFIYLHGRNTDKLTAVIAETKKLSNNENVKGFTADFSDLEAVRKMATEIKETIPQIDILINNAGVFKSNTTFNKDGLDLRYVVNYLAPYLLTSTLMPLLQKGNARRIINLSSAAQATVSYAALAGQEEQTNHQAYAQSKLALTMWSFHLAKQVPDMIVIPVNPGSLLNTRMVQEAFGKYWSSADKGANILYDLALSEAYKESTGKYFDNDQGAFGMAHADAYDEATIKKLIDFTETMLQQ